MLGLSGLKLNLIVLGIVGMLIAMISGFIYYQNNKIQSLTEGLVQEQANRERLETAIDKQEGTIMNLVETSKQQVEDINKLNESVSTINLTATENKATLHNYNSRLDKLANEKPDLISRKATRALNKTLLELAN